MPSQNPKDYYSTRLDESVLHLVGLNSKNRIYELLRLFIFFGGLALFLFLLLYKSPLFIWEGLVFIFLYLWILKRHHRLQEILDYHNRIKNVCEHELKALQGDFSQFKEGSSFIDPKHDYISDLDIFGKKSLFQYCNRTLTPFGLKILADWFKDPASRETILQRQESIHELSNKPDWILDFRSIPISEKVQAQYLNSFFKWLIQPEEILFSREMNFFMQLSPCVLAFFGLITLFKLVFPDLVYQNLNLLWKMGDFLVPWFLINLVYSGRFTKKVNRIHHILSGQAPTILAYSSIVHQIEITQFDTSGLQEIQSKIYEKSASGKSASKILKKLSRLVESFDRRLNLLISILMNGIFLSDLRLVKKLAEWKLSNQNKPQQWIIASSEMEAMLSLGVVAFNESNWVFPKLDIGHKEISGKNIGHPLIPLDKRVNNSISIFSPEQIILVTGSNMAGKSTFLRTLGVNLVLAQMGSKVCANDFHFSPISIYTSLVISDSLQENTSSFYAELKRLEVLIQRTRKGESVLFLLDEILRGTNSNDRNLGSKAVMKHLIKYKAIGILATHDLSLGEMEKHYPGEIRNMHFDVAVRGEELFFDYTLKPGICTSLNASILMKKIGLEMDS